MKFVIFVTLLLCSCVELISGSCLSYGHSCWGAHGKRSGHQPATSKQGQDLSHRWAIVKVIPERIKSNGIFISKDDLQNFKSDLTDEDRQNPEGQQSKEISSAYLINSDEDTQNHDENHRESGLRGKSTKINRKAYVYPEYEDPQTDDITNSVDDNLNKMLANRNMANMRLYKILNPNVKKSIL